MLITFLLRTARYFFKKEVVSLFPEGVHRYTYTDYYKRVFQLAHAMRSLDIRTGDNVASIAMNNRRHLGLFFIVPCIGAFFHTVNYKQPL